jgi:hypothetical protein
MLVVQWPLMFCALVPVIAIEAEVVRRQLALPTRKAFAGAAKANVLSTAAGVPLAWVVMLAVEFITAFPIMSAADKHHWQIENSPMEYVLDVLTMAWVGGSHVGVPLAAALLLVPTFFVSVYLERRSYRRSWPDLDRAAIDRSVWFANLASYLLLFVAALVWLGYEVHATGR